jgi:hypothetical protein
MTYRLFDTGKCVITERQPAVTQGGLTFAFVGAPAQNTTVTFITETAQYVRELVDGKCSAPVEKMLGKVAVVMKSIDGNGIVHSTECESIVVTQLDTDRVLVCPDDANLPSAFADLLVENQIMRDRIGRMEEKIKELSDRIEEAYAGWDLF